MPQPAPSPAIQAARPPLSGGVSSQSSQGPFSPRCRPLQASLIALFPAQVSALAAHPASRSKSGTVFHPQASLTTPITEQYAAV